jgi:YHS domain-containing protein
MTRGGVTLRFCSAQCRGKFEAAPERYLRMPRVTAAIAGEHAPAS